MADSLQKQRDQASLLLALQEVDLELSRSRELLQNPSEVQKLKQAYAVLKKIDAQLIALKGKQKDVEMAMADLDSEQRRTRAAIDELKKKAQSNSTDYRSQANFRDSYASLAKKLEKSEFTSDAILEKLGALEEQKRRLTELKQHAAQEVQAATRSAKAQVSAYQKDVAKLEGKRASIAQHLDEARLQRYEWALGRFGGLAVEVLQGSRPSVCRVSLNTAALEEAKRSGPLTQCPYCKRILVVDAQGEC